MAGRPACTPGDPELFNTWFFFQSGATSEFLEAPKTITGPVALQKLKSINWKSYEMFVITTNHEINLSL